MDYDKQRATLVKRLTRFRTGGLRDISVIDALKKVPRHLFIEPDLQAYAYEDRAMPIACEQTISQPYIVGWMSEALTLQPDHRVLEIGTGSGYQTAILAEIVKEVFTIEYYDDLAQQAQSTLDAMGYKNIHYLADDGYNGWAEAAPFNGILVACRVETVPPALIDQLKEGGSMVIPIGPVRRQILHGYMKRKGQLQSLNAIEVRFVPLLRKGKD